MTVNQYTPVARPPMSQTEAQEFVAWAKAAQDMLVQRVYEAYNRQAHLALGYESWAAMCEGERLGFYKLPADKRAPAVIQLRTLGMSQRAVGQALGVGKDTVARDAGERSISGANAPDSPTLPVPEPVLEGVIVDAPVNVASDEPTSGVADEEVAPVQLGLRGQLVSARHHLRRAKSSLTLADAKPIKEKVLDLITELNNQLAEVPRDQ